MKSKVTVYLGLLIFAVFSLNNLAQAQEKKFMSPGNWLISLQLTEGQVRVADTNGTLPSIFFPYSQNGVDLGVSYGIENNLAVSLSGNWNFSSYKREVIPTNYSENVKTSSWGIRGGVDYYIKVTDKLIIIVGPGIMFSRAKIKLEVQPTSGPAYEIDNPWFSSISLSDRIGGLINLTSHFGFSGSFGQQYSYSWFDVNSGGQDQKWKLWTSSFDARMGVVVYFGGTP